MRKLRGVLCPVSTPFNHAGELYPAKVRHNLARLARSTLAGYVLTGWIGEGALLSGAERRSLWELAADAAPDRVRIAGAAAESVHETVELARAAKELGCAGVWVRPSAQDHQAEDQQRAALFLRTVADRVELPVAIAADARRPLSAQAAADVAQHPNVAAVCYGGVDTTWITTFAASADPAKLWIGREGAWRAGWEAGSRAAVLALANVVPFHLLSVEEALRIREVEAADELIARALPASEIPELYGPPGLKAAMDLRGAYGGSPRLPSTPASVEARADIERRLAELAS